MCRASLLETVREDFARLERLVRQLSPSVTSLPLLRRGAFHSGLLDRRSCLFRREEGDEPHGCLEFLPFFHHGSSEHRNELNPRQRIIAGWCIWI